MKISAFCGLLFCFLLSCSIPKNTRVEIKLDEESLSLMDNELKEVRGVWITNVDSDVLFSADSIAIAMKKLAVQGFNVVFPVVWNEGFTLHPSEVMAKTFGEDYRQDPVLQNAGIDPLKIMTFEAHRNGMEIIPWFEFGFSSSYNNNGGHVVKLKPEWAAKDSAGNLLKKNSFEWLNGIHPEVQQFMTDLIMEVVENYDIDGIQGDDRLPAMPSHGDYSEYTLNQYKIETGNTVSMSKEPDFMSWKAGKLNEFAKNLYTKVKSFNSNLVVSFSPSVFPWSYENYLQDSPNWVKDAYVDLLVPQVYRYEIDRYKTTLDDVLTFHPGILESKTTLSSGILIKAGQKYNNYTYVKEAIAYNRKMKINGEVFFFYEGLDEKNGNLGDSLAFNEYKIKAILPYRVGNYRPTQSETVKSDSKQGREIKLDLPKMGVYDVFLKPSDHLKPLQFSNSDTRADGVEVQFIPKNEREMHLDWKFTNRIICTYPSVIKLLLTNVEENILNANESEIEVVLLYNHLESLKVK